MRLVGAQSAAGTPTPEDKPLTRGGMAAFAGCGGRAGGEAGTGIIAVRRGFFELTLQCGWFSLILQSRQGAARAWLLSDKEKQR